MPVYGRMTAGGWSGYELRQRARSVQIVLCVFCVLSNIPFNAIVPRSLSEIDLNGGRRRLPSKRSSYAGEEHKGVRLLLPTLWGT